MVAGILGLGNSRITVSSGWKPQEIGKVVCRNNHWVVGIMAVNANYLAIFHFQVMGLGVAGIMGEPMAMPACDQLGSPGQPWANGARPLGRQGGVYG